jgi:hypothetical protein
MGLFALATSQGLAQAPAGTPVAPDEGQAARFELVPAGGEKKQPDKQPEPKTPPPTEENPFAEAPRAGAASPSGPNPRMIGEPVLFSLRTIAVGSVQTIDTFQNTTVIRTVQTVISVVDGQLITINAQVPVNVVVPKRFQVPVVVAATTRVPIAGLGAYKIGENEGPAPEDRVFFTYHYYDGLRAPSGPFAFPQTVVTQTTINGFPATVSTVIPGVPPPHFALNREVFGFEKTFLDGNASFGLRVPLFEMHGDGTFGQNDLGDLTMIFKALLYRDPSNGNVVSGGLVLTVPTGPRDDTVVGNIHPTIFQPFMGCRFNFDAFFFQGFTSVAVATDSRFPTQLFNDFAIGYWLYRGALNQPVTAIIPVLEAHVTTPLNNRQLTDPIFVPDIVSLTAGVHIGIGRMSTLTFGVNTPVTGPRPFNVETGVQFNMRF